MTNKMIFKRQAKQVDRDIEYYMNNYDMDKQEAYAYLTEIYKIRYDIAKEQTMRFEKDSKLSDNNPFE